MDYWLESLMEYLKVPWMELMFVELEIEKVIKLEISTVINWVTMRVELVHKMDLSLVMMMEYL